MRAGLLGQGVDEVVHLAAEATGAVAADVAHDLVHQDQDRLVDQLEQPPDGVAARRAAATGFVLHQRDPFDAGQLPGDLVPGRLPARRAIIAAARVEAHADEDRDLGLRHSRHAGPIQDLGHAKPARGRRAAVGQVIQQGQGVGLAAAELGGEVEAGRRGRSHARQPARGLGGEVQQVLGEVGAAEELLRLPVDFVAAPILHHVEVHGELGRVQGFAFAQVLTGIDDGTPGFEGHEVSLDDQSRHYKRST